MWLAVGSVSHTAIVLQFVSIYLANQFVKIFSGIETEIMNKTRKISCPYRRSNPFLPLSPLSRFFINSCFCPMTFTIYCKRLRKLRPPHFPKLVICHSKNKVPTHGCLFLLRHRCCAFCPPLPYKSIVGKWHSPFSGSIRRPNKSHTWSSRTVTITKYHSVAAPEDAVRMNMNETNVLFNLILLFLILFSLFLGCS